MQKCDPELTVINFIGNDLLNLQEKKISGPYIPPKQSGYNTYPPL
jgi:hypothetical protein